MIFNRKFNSVYSVLLSIALICLLAVPLMLSGFKTDKIPITIKITNSNTAEVIKPWISDEKEVYYFLPSYAKPENIFFQLKTNKAVSINGDPILDNKAFNNVLLNKDCNLQIGNQSYTVYFMQSANVSTMYINTFSGNIDNVHSDKKRKEKVNITFYGENGEELYSSKKYTDQIRGHGNSTWLCEKKPYNLYLSKPQTFFENELSSNWVLLANYIDKSKIRNTIVNNLAINTSTIWNPIGDYVDLFINNEYVGQYYLVEKVESEKNKIQLEDNEVLLNLQFISRAKKYSIDNIFQGISAEICYPKKLSQDKIDELDNKIKEIIKVVKSGQATDEYIKAHVDLESWTWKYILEEFSYNNDAGAISQYFTFDGNVIKSQSAWDYDLSFGGYYYYKSPVSFLANRIWLSETIEASWFNSLLQYDLFNSMVKKQFKEEFLPKIKELTNGGIQQIYQRIKKSASMDEIRWYTDSDENNFENDVAYVQEFITRRVDFLESAWVNDVKYHSICLKGGLQYLYFSVEDNAVFSDEIPDLKALYITNFVAWIDESTGEPFDFSQPITEDKVLYALCDNKANDENNNKITELITTHKSLVISIVFCIIFAFVAIILFYLDIRRTRKG